MSGSLPSPIVPRATPPEERPDKQTIGEQHPALIRVAKGTALAIILGGVIFWFDVGQATAIIAAAATVAIASYTIKLTAATEATQRIATKTLDHLNREFVAAHPPIIRIDNVQLAGEDRDSIEYIFLNVGGTTAQVLAHGACIEWSGLDRPAPTGRMFVPVADVPPRTTLQVGLPYRGRHEISGDAMAFFAITAYDSNEMHSTTLHFFVRLETADENGVRRTFNARWDYDRTIKGFRRYAERGTEGGARGEAADY